jgi:hypothetical protein
MNVMAMTRNFVGIALLLLGGCATMTPVISGREQKLATAGFKTERVSTPEQEAMVKNLTAFVVTAVPAGAEQKYVYWDPKICKCLYVGDKIAWGHYQNDTTEFSFTNREIKATPYLDKSPWSWGPWEG